LRDRGLGLTTVIRSQIAPTLGKWVRAVRPNSSRKYLYDFVSEAADSVSQDALVLDAGAGTCPYRSLFAQVHYESADLCQIDREYGEITYVSDLTDIPVEQNRYDLVLLTQVLEHVPEPRAVLAEIHRVLKPSGVLWLSAPLFFSEHETPFDFYRYTQFGLKHLLESEGFAVKRIEWLEGYYGTLSYRFSTAVRALPLHPRHYGGGPIGALAAGMIVFVKPLALLLSVLFSHLDLQKKYTSSGQCKNYAVVAEKLPATL
jgi:SAM-dependent methyltransferase